MDFKLGMVQAAAVAVVVLFLGQKIKNKVSILEKYCIPAPVVGGLIFVMLTLFLKVTNILVFDMDTTLQKLFMTAFFTTIGFTASLKILKKGGKGVFLFLMAATVLVILQNFTGVALAKMFGINPLIGLATGSTSMTGGHGTAGAFGPIFENAGAVGASTVAMAAATFGLIAGSVIGGPIGKRLLEKKNLMPSKQTINKDSSAEVAATEVKMEKKLSTDDCMGATTQILIAMGIGTVISILLEKEGMTFPIYIGGMLAAAAIRNISDSTKAYKVYMEEIDVIGSISLGIFLSMALMGLKLWQLADLALPLIVMLMAQAILIGLFAYFVTFKVMGKDYDSAVLACGHCGFGMGATPNAMANMEAMTQEYGPARRAFFVLPLVGGLFIDFTNAGVLTLFMNFFG